MLSLPIRRIPLSVNNDISDVIEKSEWQTILTTGMSSQIFKVPINGSAFLQVGGKFTATLSDAGLNYGLLI